MKPYYDHDGITIYHGDCREILPTLEPVDLVLTDPPYNTLSDHDIDLAGRSPMKRNFGDWDEGWVPPLDEWFRVVNPGGSVLAFSSDRLISEYRKGPFKPRGTLVWVKDNPAPAPRPAYVQATEWIVWLQRHGGAATWNGNGYITNVLHSSVCAGDERKDHPTQKPIKLIRPLILRHSNKADTILDPFMGSGTTLRAAKDLGRKAIGIEIEERYCEIAANRMAQGVLL